MEEKDKKKIEEEKKDIKKEEEKNNELKNKLTECEKLKQQYLSGWQKERADFLNYKKEETQRLQEFLKISVENFAQKILLILDSFDLAENKLSINAKNDENIKGFLQIKKQLTSILKELGVEEIEILNKEFNPQFAEVVGEIETKEGKPGIIIEIVQKGYKIFDKVLRPAKVKISKQPTSSK